MAFENQRLAELLFLINVISLSVLADNNDNIDRDSGGVSIGVIVAVSIVGFLIALIAIILCFHDSCTKHQRSVKSERISVIGVGHHAVPPSHHIPTAPPLGSTGICPVDPPPYRRYDDEYYTPMEPVNTYQPRDPFSRQPSSQQPRGQFGRQQSSFTFSSSRDHVNRQTPSTLPPPY